MGNEDQLTGDVFESPMQAGEYVEGGAVPPDYGDPLDITAEALSIGDVLALEGLGDPSEQGFLALPNAFTSVRTRPTGLSTKAGPRTVNAVVAQGRNNAKAQLALAGIGNPAVQRTAMDTALMTARLARLGDRAAGKIAPSDMLPFSYAEKGRLHMLNNIREGAGCRADILKIYLQQQLVPPSLPFRRFISSTIPAAGATVDLTAALPATSAAYNFLVFVVRMSSTLLNSNPSKTLTLTVSEGTGGVVSNTYQQHVVSYDTDGVVQLVIIPGYPVSGNYWPRLLTGQNTGVVGTTRNLNFTVTGNDGTSDNLTIFGIGPDDFYWRQFMNRLS